RRQRDRLWRRLPRSSQRAERIQAGDNAGGERPRECPKRRARPDTGQCAGQRPFGGGQRPSGGDDRADDRAAAVRDDGGLRRAGQCDGEQPWPRPLDLGGIDRAAGRTARIHGHALVCPTPASPARRDRGDRRRAPVPRCRKAVADVTARWRPCRARVTFSGRRSFVIDRWHLTRSISSSAGLQRCHGWRGRPSNLSRRSPQRRSAAEPARLCRYPGADTRARRDAEPCMGRNGHGYVASFEIGNEEYDGYWGGSWANTLPCRAANYYGPVLRAGYEAVKAQSPNALVGMFGMWWVDTGHVQSYMTWLYANGYGRYMDFANFHYYPGGNPAVTSGSTPSFDLEWSTIHAVQVAYGDAAKPVWCTETGWAVSSVNQGSNPVVTLAQQSQYLQYVLDSSRNSGVMQPVFIYMISDTGYDGMNIYTPSGPLPSYNMLESYMAQYPAWGAAPSPTPTPTPTPAPTPTPTPAPTAAPTPTPAPI